MLRLKNRIVRFQNLKIQIKSNSSKLKQKTENKIRTPEQFQNSKHKRLPKASTVRPSGCAAPLKVKTQPTNPVHRICIRSRRAISEGCQKDRWESCTPPPGTVWTISQVLPTLKNSWASFRDKKPPFWRSQIEFRTQNSDSQNPNSELPTKKSHL